jgi:periplasmic divalent cation tolerance protein
MTDQDNVLVAFTTCPSEKEAESIAGALVEERLAACVTRIPGVTSTYIWKGLVQNDRETVLMIKTTTGRFDALKARVKELHPYELPELIAIPVCAGAENYLAWVRDTVTELR